MLNFFSFNHVLNFAFSHKFLILSDFLIFPPTSIFLCIAKYIHVCWQVQDIAASSSGGRFCAFTLGFAFGLRLLSPSARPSAASMALLSAMFCKRCSSYSLRGIFFQSSKKNGDNAFWAGAYHIWSSRQQSYSATPQKALATRRHGWSSQLSNLPWCASHTWDITKVDAVSDVRRSGMWRVYALLHCSMWRYIN